MVATKRLKLAMETDEKRKARLEKMVATTQLRLAFGGPPPPMQKNGGLLTQKLLAASNGEFYTDM